MKKTIVTLTAACMLAVTGISANNNAEHTDAAVMETNVVAPEISSFCKAIVKGDIDTVRSLIELGENINRKSLGMTPAMFAARYNKTEILKLLIKEGADLKIRCDKGYTIKKYAELSNAKEALAILNKKM
ncbi:ankyrin repeat domain-containing protein [Spongiimicrobium salis]|uniref:ankyrin repeat domain-containing protein n=1 Tax=Spongiimicrobium salis TaxID=1667022 RepID=UPI00374DDA68